MGRIQRAPQGLLDILSAKGVEFLPADMLNDLRPVLDLLQLYGLQQRQYLSNANAALAENGVVTITPGSPFILFGVSGVVTKTATMTALQFDIAIGRTVAEAIPIMNSGSQAPFGATETGVISVPVMMPYPRMMPANSSLFFRLEILGTDATANCGFTAEIGLVG